jgi:hypothetical protein
MIDFEGTICNAILTELAAELSSVTPAVQLLAFGSDADASARRIEVNAEVVGTENTWTEAQVYQQTRRAVITAWFGTPKMGAADVGNVTTKIRGVIERSYRKDSPANYAMSQVGLTVATQPIQTVMLRQEAMAGELPMLTVLLTYEALLYYQYTPPAPPPAP